MRYYATANGRLHMETCGQLPKASHPDEWKPGDWRPDWLTPCLRCLAGEWPTS